IGAQQNRVTSPAAAGPDDGVVAAPDGDLAASGGDLAAPGGDLAAPGGDAAALGGRLPRVIDILDRDGLIEPEEPDSDRRAVGDLTREPLDFPAGRDVRLHV